MASKFQIRKIHTLKNLLAIEDDVYREMLMSFDVQSSTDLTFTEASILLDILEEKAVALNLWIKQKLKYTNLKRDNMATPAQLRMIESLWRELAYIDTDKFAKSSLRVHLQNNYKINDIMFLTKYKANKVINGIKSMKANLERKKCGHTSM